MGFIKMKMVPSLLHHAQPNFMAKQLWDELKTAYAMPGAATVFADFHKAIRFQLQSEADAAGNIPPHPRPLINELRETLTRLGTNNCALPDFAKAMILVAGIPRDWEGIKTIILSNASNATTAAATTGQLVFNTVADQIVAEYERRYQGFRPQDQPSGSNIASLSNRITAVNRQSGNAPKFQKQFNQPRQEQGGDQSQSQKKRRGGKAVKQRWLDAKAKAEEKGKGPEIAPQHSHSFGYFASAANQHSLRGVGHSVQLGSHLLAIPSPPPSLPIPLSQNKALSRKSSCMFEKVTIAANASVKDVRKHAEPQQFTGSKPGDDSYYPTVNIARALASNLEVVKTTETMKKLELDVNAMDLHHEKAHM